MDRREFLRTTGGMAALAGSATLAATPAVADAPEISAGAKRLSLGVTWISPTGGLLESARRLSARVRTLSGGGLDLAVEPGPAALSNLAGGDADAVLGSAHDLLALDRAFAYLAGLPADAGLGRHDTVAWLLVGGGNLLMEELGLAHGVRPLFAGSTGQRGTLWSRRPITAAADLAGLRVYAEGLQRDVVRALGAEVADTRPETLASSLAEGAIDAVQWGGPVASYDAGLPGSAREAMVCGLARYGSNLTLTLGAATWARLAETERAILSVAASEETQTTAAEARAYDPVMRKALETVQGVRFSEPSAELRHAVGRVADAVVAHVAAQSPEAGRINASYMAFRDTVRGRRGGSRGSGNASIS